MAKKKKKKKRASARSKAEPHDSIQDVPLHATTRRRYLNYAMSVITSRALPDVRAVRLMKKSSWLSSGRGQPAR